MHSSKASPRRPIEFAPTTTMTTTKLSLFFFRSLTSSSTSSSSSLSQHQHQPQTKKQNRKNTPERLEIKKYNKFLKRHTVHKEIK